MASSSIPVPNTSLPRRRPRILIGLTGSVATVKYQELCIELSRFASVRIVPTNSALPFIDISNTTYKPEYQERFRNTISTEEYENKEDIPLTLTLPQFTEPSPSIPFSSTSSSSSSSGESRSTMNAPLTDNNILYLIPRKLPDTIYTDTMEWSSYRNVHTDPVLHIELRKWCDICLISPCSANTLAKIFHGLCDNLLTTIIRAWEFQMITGSTADDGNGTIVATYKPVKPVLIAPAMNTAMWNHPLTLEQVNSLSQKYGYRFISPQNNKVLACGDVGTGAMASVDTIVQRIKEELRKLGWIID